MEAATAVTTPINPNGESEPMTLAEIRSLLQHTAQTTAENARAIAEMRAAEAERAARHDEEMAAFRAAQEERDARHDKEMAEIRAARAARTARHDEEMAAFRATEAERAARHDEEMSQIRAAQEERDARHDKEMAEIRSDAAAFRATQEERAARHDEEMAAFRAAEEERAARHDEEMAAFRAVEEERAARHDKEMAQIRADTAAFQVAQEERDARRDKEMAVIQAAIAELTAGHQRNSQDISTLKGWGLEIYCERNPQIFSDALGLADAELIPKRDILRVSSIARMAGVITDDQRRNLIRADAFFYARREADHQPFCLVVEASFRVDDEDVARAAGRAEILDAIIKKYQPRNLNGDAVPIVAGIDITSGAWLRARNSNVKYVEIQNGKQLTNPPE